jgi:hypothetical protein
MAKRQKVERSEEPCILLFGSHDVRVGDNRALELATRNYKVANAVFLWTVKGKWGVRGALEVLVYSGQGRSTTKPGRNSQEA